MCRAQFSVIKRYILSPSEKKTKTHILMQTYGIYRKENVASTVYLLYVFLGEGEVSQKFVFSENKYINTHTYRHTIFTEKRT